jgi:hypothetical protein
MCAAVEDTVGFHTVTDNPALTMRARWRQRLYRALETVKSAGLSSLDDLEGFVVIVTADLADGHGGDSRVTKSKPNARFALGKPALSGLDEGWQLGRAATVTNCVRRQRGVVELNLIGHAAKHQSSAAHVTTANESRWIVELGPERGCECFHVLASSDAAEQHDACVG